MLSFEPYKFIGDGWILLFPGETNLPELLSFLSELSTFFEQEYLSSLSPILEIRPKPVGLKFGIDRGRLVRIVMLNKREYVGRPLNVATRLQSALSQVDQSPAYKVLISRPAYKGLGSAPGYKAESVAVSLKNIQDSPYRCIKLSLSV